MKADEKILDMQRRIQHWLSTAPSASSPGTIEALDADISSLEAQLRSLFPNGESAQDAFEALREQAMFRTVLESMVEGVVVADMAGRLLVFNSAARRLLGQGRSDAGPQGWSETYGFFHSDGSAPYPSEQLPLSRAMRGESVEGEELLVRTPGRAGHIYIHATARPLWDSQGQQIGAVVVFHDVTASRMVENELRRARNKAEDASRAKSEFLANMSHEIRTPLTAVLGFADLLLDPELNESEKLNYIQAVRRNGEHLLSLINDVLDLSKIQAKKMSVENLEFSLEQVLHEVGSVMQVRAHEKGLGFEVVYETPIPVYLQSDALRVRQVLLNLLSNAVKFTSKGHVTLTVRCVDAGTDSSRVEFVISDTGIGMTESEVAALFQTFHQANPSTTRQYGGTGLGLAISASLAEALGGEITVDSAIGEGSTFTFVLRTPIDAEAVISEEHVLVSGELADKPNGVDKRVQLTGRILLAEDGIDNQLLISTILRRHGVQVELAGDGEAAVAEALRSLASGKPYDLVLMDMQMPKLDGYGATAKLRSKGYSGPIVALTAHAMAGERDRCMAVGCDDYLTKPIGRTELVTAVQAHLLRGQRRGDPALAESEGAVHEEGEYSQWLYSSYADDPEMADLIAGFVKRLSGNVENICSASEAGDMDLLQRLAHQLKGSAGGFGFMPLSEQAAKLEVAVRDKAGADHVRDAVTRLVNLSRRVAHDHDTEVDRG